MKGAGVDCANLVIAVYAAVGLIQAFEEQYSPQWFLHRDEPRFLNTLARYAHQVTVPDTGDVAMYKFGRHAAHAAIIISPISMVHAYRPAGRVLRDDPMAHAARLHSYWSVFT